MIKVRGEEGAIVVVGCQVGVAVRRSSVHAGVCRARHTWQLLRGRVIHHGVGICSVGLSVLAVSCPNVVRVVEERRVGFCIDES